MGMFITVKIDREKCNLCRKCEICPVDIFRFNDGVEVVDEDECLLCNACLDVCEQEAIEIVKEYEVES